MAHPVRDLPVELTSAGWKKHKGIMATLVKKKTGVTEALQAFEHEYNEWRGWQFLGIDAYPKILNDFQKASLIKDGKGEYIYSKKPYPLMVELLRWKHEEPKFVGNLKVRLDLIRKLADPLSKEFKANKLMPSATRVFLEEMCAKCSGFLPDLTQRFALMSRIITTKLMDPRQPRDALRQLHIF